MTWIQTTFDNATAAITVNTPIILFMGSPTVINNAVMNTFDSVCDALGGQTEEQV